MHKLLTLAYVDRTCRRFQDKRMRSEEEDTYGPLSEGNHEVLWFDMNV